MVGSVGIKRVDEVEWLEPPKVARRLCSCSTVVRRSQMEPRRGSAASAGSTARFSRGVRLAAAPSRCTDGRQRRHPRGAPTRRGRWPSCGGAQGLAVPLSRSAWGQRPVGTSGASVSSTTDVVLDPGRRCRSAARGARRTSAGASSGLQRTHGRGSTTWARWTSGGGYTPRDLAPTGSATRRVTVILGGEGVPRRGRRVRDRGDGRDATAPDPVAGRSCSPRRIAAITTPVDRSPSPTPWPKLLDALEARLLAILTTGRGTFWDGLRGSGASHRGGLLPPVPPANAPLARTVLGPRASTAGWSSNGQTSVTSPRGQRDERRPVARVPRQRG